MLGERAVLGALARTAPAPTPATAPAAAGDGTAAPAPAPSASASPRWPPSAWSSALLAVPRTLRMMYLHAWQSAAVRTYGCERAVEGDLVLPRGGSGADEAAVAEAAGGADELAAAAEADGADAEAMEGAEEDVHATNTSGGGGGGGAAARLAAVRVVSAADAAAGRYSVYDVVLPLPGTEVLYPQHETGHFMRQAAAEAGVDLAQPSASSGPAPRELSFASLTGDYRRLLHRPADFSYALKRYTDPNDDSLVETDLERLQRGPPPPPYPPPPPLPPPPAGATIETAAEAAAPPAANPSTSGTTTAAAAAAPTPSAAAAAAGSAAAAGGVAVTGSGPRLGLELRFRLPASCYATMLLRELMKTSTSKAFHQGLSAAAAATAAVAAAAGGDEGGATVDGGDGGTAPGDVDGDGAVAGEAMDGDAPASAAD
ncbi:hypothetical protein GPECTOR_43g881 [Gonium pectorale]|uniref:TRUD domain-containing protein n=1 Tax=Gonium pectorale TaxID=33097 RepID=A0A150GA51_GONPE|nr:hypothetical protein GPECTOR_43g881 [Gonium pectorale]|eukprot:KXZ46445.1 hypothetical protein GPECTOR_43g881 [Gonium pectorale]